MKTTKITAVLAAAVLTGAAAFAGDLAATTVTNAKGQQAVLYRDTEPSIALYTGERGAVMASNQRQPELTPALYSNNKGPSFTLYWAD